jgi:hypothetical protein
VSAVTRSWIAFAAVGAGLIHLALVISAPLVGGVLLAAVGIAEFAWGVLVMFDERFLVPRIAVIAALAPVALWIAALLLGVQAFRPAPLAVATLLELFIALAIARSLRRDRVAAAASTRRYVIGLLVGALVIGTLTASALAVTAPAGSAILFDDGVHH